MSDEKAAVIVSQYADFLENKRADMKFTISELIEASRILSNAINLDRDDLK